MEMRPRGSKSMMARCLDLAAKGVGWVHPNPLVGCVIVKAGKVIGEGYHRRFGGPHAEIHALRAAGSLALGATLYVNLEPCAHHGKTPPCTDAIVNAGIRRVVAAAADPNPLVAGKGFRKLRASGIDVSVGLMRAEAVGLNRSFYHFMSTGRPYVVVKLAQTIDGLIADEDGHSRWITGPAARREVHRLRSLFDAVLVGAGTVAMDDPRLTVRAAGGRNPVRVVLDPSMSLPESRQIFDTSESRTILLTSRRALQRLERKALRLMARGVEVASIGTGTRVRSSEVLEALALWGISSLLIEGGAATVKKFFEERLVNELIVMTAPRILGGGKPGLRLSVPRPVSSPFVVDEVRWTRLGVDMMMEGRIINP